MFNDAFVSQAWEVRRVGSIKDINVLPSSDTSEHEQMKRCMEIGLLCTQFNPADRPTMVDVLDMLNGKKEVPTPRKPRYMYGIDYLCESSLDHFILSPVMCF